MMELLKDIIKYSFFIVIGAFAIFMFLVFILALGSQIKDAIVGSRFFNKLFLNIGIILNKEFFKDYAMWGQKAKVLKYLKAGMDINYQDKFFGETVLMVAAEHGRLEIVQALLDAGADASLFNQHCWSAAMLAAHNGNNELIRYLVTAEKKKTGRFTSLFHSAASGLTEVVLNFIMSGEDVNQKDEDGNTALMYASGLGKLKTVEVLIKKDAVVDEKNSEGKTALSLAVSLAHSFDSGWYHRYLRLLSLGDRLGDCLVDSSGYQDIVKLLLAAGANLNTIDNSGKTPLMHALESGNKDIAWLLMEAGADVTSKNCDNLTAMYYAQKLQDHELISGIEVLEAAQNSQKLEGGSKNLGESDNTR